MSAAASNTIPPIPGAKKFRIALVQLGQVGSDKAANLKHAREMILKAAAGDGSAKPDMIVLPEFFNSPYGVSYFPGYAEKIGYVKDKKYDIESSTSESVKMLSSAAKETGTWLIGGSIPEHEEPSDKLYNTSTVYNPQGDMIAIHRKLHLFDIDIPGKITFKESESLTGGSAVTQFATEFGNIGLGICYDVRFPEMAMIAARQGCVAMIYPGAFNLTTGPLHWELLARARANDNQIYVALCSPARDMSATYHAWGHSTLVDPMGVVKSTMDENEGIIYGDIDPQVIQETRQGIPVTVQRRFDVYKNVAE
ncbi:carbon-nitrogen hydrolase [Clavulina sp. PMI_390]|nr:carbon-nitrogen hydrolase [Clavulina sp. PMI_390]